MNKHFLHIFTTLFLISACATANETTCNKDYQNYLTWLNSLKNEMLQKGIKQETLDKVYAQNDFYKPQADALVHDRKQTEFVLSPTDYLNRVVSKSRTQKALAKYQELKPTLNKISSIYNLPPEYIIAFFAIESDFGKSMGNYNIFAALTEMSYDKRRSTFFKQELYNALKILEKHDINPDSMRSSWAGAMGQFQFMPSTFNNYAVDFNNDNKIDIWNDFEDAAASAANYLTSIGWDKNIPWGEAVILPWNFDYKLTSRFSTKTIAQWKKLGVKKLSGKPLNLNNSIQASIIVPQGHNCQAYLITDNFKKIMKWNNSENYALAIGLLANYIKTSNNWHKQTCSTKKIKTEEIELIQLFINKTNIANLAIDGQLGSKTKQAIQILQKKFLMIPDGYPSQKLISKIKNYNPKLGFSIPVPPKKLHKPK